MVVNRARRNTIWSIVLFALLIFAGICAIGYWQSYDRNCGGFGKGLTWSWKEFPPQYVCMNHV